MSNRSELSRRSLIKVVSGAGACLMLGAFSGVACGNPTMAIAASGGKKSGGKIFEPNAFIKIEPDGTATITVKTPDMGQGTRTSLAMLVAEDLDLDWKKVHVVQAPADLSQGAGGSASIRSMHDQLRQMGAKARMMLIAAAAKQWGVEPSSCTTSDGHVIHAASKRSLSYGDLTAAASAETMPSAPAKLKDPSEFKLLGKPTSRVDNPNVTRGAAKYGLDARVEGMVYAVMSRPPCRGATLTSFDEAAARKVPGVVDVVKVGDGVAVIGKHTWAALGGRKALNEQWDLGKNGSLDSAQITAQLKAAQIPHPDVPAGAKMTEATFEFPFLAHATMEPMNATVRIGDGECEVWAPTQQPDGALRTVAGMLKIPADKVAVHVTLVGGGFGRRLFQDYVQEAVAIAQIVKKPVQLVWSREDDMKHDRYRPAVFTSMRGAIDASGNPVAWSHQCMQAQGRGDGDFGGADIPYKIPGAKQRMGGVSTPIPTGPWRSVEHTYTITADECFIDQMAHLAGKDPFEYRRALLQDDRLRNVLELAAKNGDWGKPLPKGHGRGIACFSGYGSYAAHVAEVSVGADGVQVHRIVAVIDCGFAVNPKSVEAQIQGACVDGMSMALRAAITIEKGCPAQSSWTDYNWMTMDAMPRIETHIVQGSKDPGGMGEPGVPSVCPAICNAVFAATGKRVRKFPISVDELV